MSTNNVDPRNNKGIAVQIIRHTEDFLSFHEPSIYQKPRNQKRIARALKIFENKEKYPQENWIEFAKNVIEQDTLGKYTITPVANEKITEEVLSSLKSLVSENLHTTFIWAGKQTFLLHPKSVVVEVGIALACKFSNDIANLQACLKTANEENARLKFDLGAQKDYSESLEFSLRVTRVARMKDLKAMMNLQGKTNKQRKDITKLISLVGRYKKEYNKYLVESALASHRHFVSLREQYGVKKNLFERNKYYALRRFFSMKKCAIRKFIREQIEFYGPQWEYFKSEVRRSYKEIPVELKKWWVEKTQPKQIVVENSVKKEVQILVPDEIYRQLNILEQVASYNGTEEIPYYSLFGFNNITVGRDMPATDKVLLINEISDIVKEQLNNPYFEAATYVAAVNIASYEAKDTTLVNLWRGEMNPEFLIHMMNTFRAFGYNTAVVHFARPEDIVIYEGITPSFEDLAEDFKKHGDFSQYDNNTPIVLSIPSKIHPRIGKTAVYRLHEFTSIFGKPMKIIAPFKPQIISIEPYIEKKFVDHRYM